MLILNWFWNSHDVRSLHNSVATIVTCHGLHSANVKGQRSILRILLRIEYLPHLLYRNGCGSSNKVTLNEIKNSFKFSEKCRNTCGHTRICCFRSLTCTSLPSHIHDDISHINLYILCKGHRSARKITLNARSWTPFLSAGTMTFLEAFLVVTTHSERFARNEYSTNKSEKRGFTDRLVTRKWELVEL